MNNKNTIGKYLTVFIMLSLTNNAESIIPIIPIVNYCVYCGSFFNLVK